MRIDRQLRVTREKAGARAGGRAGAAGGLVRRADGRGGGWESKRAGVRACVRGGRWYLDSSDFDHEHCCAQHVPGVERLELDACAQRNGPGRKGVRANASSGSGWQSGGQEPMAVGDAIKTDERVSEGGRKEKRTNRAEQSGALVACVPLWCTTSW